jgi:putative transposase
MTPGGSNAKEQFSENTIITILKAVEVGRAVRDVCREHEVSEATYYKWKTKYGGMEAADIRRCVNWKKKTTA